MSRRPTPTPETPRSITPTQAIPLLSTQLEKLRQIASTRPINLSLYKAWEGVIRELLIKSFGSGSQNIDDVVHAIGGLRHVGMSDEEIEQNRVEKIAQQVASLEGCLEQLKMETQLQSPEEKPEEGDRASVLEDVLVQFSNDATLFDAEQFAIDHQDKYDAYDSLLRDHTLDWSGGKLNFSLRSYVNSKFWAKDEALLNTFLPILKKMYSEKKGALHEVSDLMAHLDQQGLHTVKGIDIERTLRLFERLGLLGGFNQTNDGGIPRIKSFSVSQTILRPKSITDQVKLYVGSAQTISSAMTLGSDLVTAIVPAPAKDNKKVFIVHGHDGKAREAVAQSIRKLDLEPIILHEQANQGDTVIEKFERNSNVGFAIILMTSDDTGKANSEAVARPRARQNVVFEWGYFVGKLGRKRVCALYEQGIDLPSDLNGIVYIPLDATGNWRFALLKELKAAGYTVDANKLLE